MGFQLRDWEELKQQKCVEHMPLAQGRKTRLLRVRGSGGRTEEGQWSGRRTDTGREGRWRTQNWQSKPRTVGNLAYSAASMGQDYTKGSTASCQSTAVM